MTLRFVTVDTQALLVMDFFQYQTLIFLSQVFSEMAVISDFLHPIAMRTLRPAPYSRQYGKGSSPARDHSPLPPSKRLHAHRPVSLIDHFSLGALRLKPLMAQSMHPTKGSAHVLLLLRLASKQHLLWRCGWQSFQT